MDIVFAGEGEGGFVLATVLFNNGKTILPLFSAYGGPYLASLNARGFGNDGFAHPEARLSPLIV